VRDTKRRSGEDDGVPTRTANGRDENSEGIITQTNIETVLNQFRVHYSLVGVK
jgi:hypothetical protein